MPSVSKKDAFYSEPSNSVARRVVEYLLTHRSEVLNRHDIAVKFDTDASTVDALLAPAVAAGLLKKGRDSDSVIVWRRPLRIRGGANNAFPGFTGAAKPSLGIDFDAIVIEHGVPISEPRKRGKLWDALFDRMKAGDSFKLPATARDAAAHARASYIKRVPSARFVIRKISNTEARVWRTA